MAKPTEDTLNHGKAVSAFVKELQAARIPGENPGIGKQVSAFASGKGGPAATDDFPDGQVLVLKADGTRATFTSLSDAVNAAADGETLHIGAGTYAGTLALDKAISIIGEHGAIIDGSATTGAAATIELSDGFSGGKIEGLTLVAVDGGSALASVEGQVVTGVSISGNTFDAGDNTGGALVYLHEGVDGAVIGGNVFEGAALATSPLLAIDADDVQVTGNTFGLTSGAYAKVELFAGADGVTTDIVLTGNVGLGTGDVIEG